MRSQKFGTILLVFTTLIFSCEHKTNTIESEFNVTQDYAEFSTNLENKDTLNIVVNLSMCIWSEYDRLQITKSNDSIFLELKEKYVVMDDKSFHFSKVVYELKNDTLSLEKMMSDFDINFQEETSSPFFTITNPKENDTILLRTTGLVNTGFNIERYQRIMFELYPEEMEDYRNEYLIPPNEIIETELE